MALDFGSTKISALFEDAGTALLEFAERAESNRMQGRFFEAMALVQRGRPNIEHSFGRALAEGFDNLGNRQPSSSIKHANYSQRDSVELSLVGPDELEESVAAENLIHRASAEFFPELFVLSQRFTVLNNGQKLNENEIPVGPHQLVRSFRRAISVIDVEVKIKVILFALFDRFVIKQAKELYDELNDTLKAAHILPDLRPSQVQPTRRDIPISRRPRPSPPSKEGGRRALEREHGWRMVPIGSDVPSLGAQLFDSIIELMSTRHSVARSARGSPASVRIPPDPAASAAEARLLFSALHELQSQATTQTLSGLITRPEGVGHLESNAAFVKRIENTLNRERDQVLSQIDREKLSSMDSDLIDLIGMLFQYMLNDAGLPNLAKALLSHLHTPYLKVAIIDRRLLVDSRHPARRLLDQMVEAGSLWVDENNPDRGVFPAMRRVVDRVLQDFADDVSLFGELLSEFERDMNEQKRRTVTMEQRTQEAARGREKLQLAKRRAFLQVQRLIQDRRLPQPVTTFLSHNWLDLMVFILLREELRDRSDAWTKAVETAEALVSLFDPQAAPAEQRDRASIAAQLRERILEGIQCMGTGNRSALDTLSALLETPEAWEMERTSEGIEPPVHDRRARKTPPPASPLAEGSGAEGEKTTAREQEIIRRLRKVKLGTWFELRVDVEESPRRIKLSWLSPLTATCMFVDRSGMQAEIKTLQELAQDLLSGRAKVISRPKHPFIERALVSIRKMLQRNDEEPSDAAR